MEPERWQQIDQLLEQALEASPEERSAFLDATCRRRPDLRRAVEKLLRAHERAGGFLGVSAAGNSSQGVGHGPDRNSGGPNARPLRSDFPARRWRNGCGLSGS